MKKLILMSLCCVVAATTWAEAPKSNLPVSKPAPELGQIEAINGNGDLTFYKGDLDIKVGDELHINERGVMARLIVGSVSGDRATGTILGVRSGLFGERINITQLSKVRLTMKHSELNWLAFNLGANSAKKTGGYGGVNGFLGLDVGGHFQELYTWDILIQADTYGKDSLGTEIRRSAYMLGVGKDFDRLNFTGYLGTVDTMTITKDASAQGNTNPYTGEYYNKSIQHNDEFGYMLALNYRFDINEVSYKKRTGFSINPRISYTNTFSSGKYGGYTSFGVSLTMWIENYL